jgi:hypothetical protein
METKFGDVGHRDVGHRVEAQPESGVVSDITHAVTGNGSDAFQAALKKAAAAVGTGIQDRRDEVIAYARREPVAALTAAAGIGFLAGLVLAIGSRSGAASGAWFPQLSPRRRSFLGKRTGSGWREFLQLE